MAERVRLRLRNAEEVIAKAKELAAVREEHLQRLKEKGQVMPPEAALLGCWQTIEQTVLCNSNSNLAEIRLGNFRTFFQSLSPDGHLFGQAISSGSIVLSGPHAGKPWPITSTYEVTGRIIGEGLVRYRTLPKEGKEFVDLIGGYKMRRLPELTEAHWQRWELEGKFYDYHNTEAEFKAVR